VPEYTHTYTYTIATGWTAEVRFLAGGIRFFPLHNVQIDPGDQPTSYPTGAGVKRPEL
jgi:hypothetical protein